MKRLVAELPDNKYLTILFVDGQKTKEEEGDVMFVITGEEYPHLRIMSIGEAEKIVKDAGHPYIIEDISSDTAKWWK